jgi:hypothetical protein
MTVMSMQQFSLMVLAAVLARADACQCAAGVCTTEKCQYKKTDCSCISFPDLSEATGYIHIESNKDLEFISLPKLETAVDITIKGNPKLRSIHLPLLDNVAFVTIVGTKQLTEVKIGSSAGSFIEAVQIHDNGKDSKKPVV